MGRNECKKCGWHITECKCEEMKIQTGYRGKCKCGGDIYLGFPRDQCSNCHNPRPKRGIIKYWIKVFKTILIILKTGWEHRPNRKKGGMNVS